VQKNVLLSNHGAMEDVILFSPMWWNNLPAEYQTVITDTFEEVIPELIAHKAAGVASALEEIKASGTNVRELGEEEKAALREAMYPAARKAYLDRAGDEGAALMKTYEKQ